MSEFLGVIGYIFGVIACSLLGCSAGMLFAHWLSGKLGWRK